MRRLVLLLLIVPCPVLAQDRPLLIRNATVETLGPSGKILGGSVLIRDGKIAAVGKDVAAPDNAAVIDAAGGTVMPGVIDPYFKVAIAAATADSGPRTVVIRGQTFTIPGGRTSGGFTRVADNFYPFDSGFKPLPRLGLTRINLVTSSLGQAAIVRVTPDQPEKMLANPDGLAFATVTNSTESLDQIRTRLSRPSGSRPASAPSATGSSPQLWADVLEGKASLVIEASNSATVAHLLKALEPHKNVKLVLFLGGEVAAETAPLLKERKVSVLLRPQVDLLPNTRDRFSAARLLHEAGVPFIFSLTARPPTTSTTPGFGSLAPSEETSTALNVDADFPLFAVALMVKSGLPRTAALEALTKRPAALLGLEKTHGTIEPGKAADLLLFTGDPLDQASRLQHTIIDGGVVYAY